MPSLADRVRRTIRRHDLVPRGGRVLAAVSGGPDSVAMCHLLGELTGTGEIELVALAHLNHELRGEASDADERFCRDLAAALSLPIEVERADVRALARERRTSIEDAARSARYGFFARAAARHRADRIAVGHTRDDQAETILLRLIRGSGPRGLGSIFPRAGSVVRPLIDMPREDLRRYLDGRGLPFREDASNWDLAIPRNRVRHDLLPQIRRHFSDGVDAALARAATIARDDADWLDRAAAQAAGGVVAPRNGRVELDVAALMAQPPALRRRIVRMALAVASGGRFVGFGHVEALLGLAAGETTAADLPGQRVELAPGRIVLTTRQTERGAAGRETFFRYALSIPGEAVVPEAACVVSASEAVPATAAAAVGLAARGDSAVVDAGTLTGPLVVRSRLRGDAFRPIGLGGRKKLQDLFVDRKVPRADRSRVPIVADELGRIVWVAGHGLANGFRVTEATQAVIILEMKRLGGGV